METWAYDDPQFDSRAQHVVDYLEQQTKNPELSENAGKLWDLYLFLNGRTFQSPAELQSSVFLDSKRTQPLFSDREAMKVFEMLQKKGGTLEGESPEAVDNIILRWIGFVREWSPAFIKDTADTLAPYVFILKGLEESPEFGELLAIALDATEAGLKSTAAVIQNTAPVIVGLLPIPEAGPVGAVLGWLVASVFIFLLVAIHISRKQFGQAFIASFGLIPVVGESLYNVAMSGEKFLQKTSERRDRLIQSVRNVAGNYAADTLDALVPDPLAVPDPNAPGFADILQKMQDDARAKLEGLQGQAIEKVKANTIDKVQTRIQEKIALPNGGIRFSRRRHVKSKWRTQRRK